jgi:uncharacterized membrane protein (DUF106 family)
MSSNVAVFEADIDTSKLEAGSARAKKAFNDIGSSGVQSFDSLQAKVSELERKIESLEQKNQKAKGSFTQLAGSVTGLTTNLASAYFSFDNLDKVQLRVTKSQRLVEEQQAKINQMQRQGKTNTEEYRFELRQLEEMQERVRQSQSDLNQANFMTGLTLTTLATSTIPNSIKSIQGLNLSLQTVRTTLWTIATHPVFLAVTGFFLAWEFGISKVIEKAAGLKDGEASIVQGLQKMWEGQNKVTSDGISGFTGYTGAIEGTSSSISSLGSGLDTVTEKTSKLVTSYSQLVEMAKGGKGIRFGDIAGNYNDSTQRLLEEELFGDKFNGFDKFIDSSNINFVSEYSEQWKAIKNSINNADLSSTDYFNHQERVRRFLIPDMKEYGEAIKRAHDTKAIRDFRNEINQMVKEMRLAKEDAKDLLSIFDGQKKSSDKLGRTDIENLKAYARDLGFTNVAQLYNSLNNNEGGDWAGLFMRRIHNLKRSGKLGTISTNVLESYVEALRVEGLINQMNRTLDSFVNLTLQGDARSIATAQRRFIESVRNNQSVGQIGGLGIGTFGTSPSFRASVQNIGGGVQRSNSRSSVSGSQKARRGGHGGSKPGWGVSAVEKPFLESSKHFNSIIDELSFFGFNISAPSFNLSNLVKGYKSPSNEFLQTSIRQATASYESQVQEFNRRVEAAKSEILGGVSSLGITSLSSLRSILENPLTTNDVQAQLEFQRRLASMSS